VARAVNGNYRRKALDMAIGDERPGRELRVAAMEWLRGPAKLDGDWIELDRERSRTYAPIETTDLMYDLAAVRRPSDALAFVQRYGLLRNGPGAERLREPVADIEEEAHTLSTTLGLYVLIRRAVGDDAQESNDAMRQLWDNADKLAEGFDNRAASGDELIDQATQLVTYWINQGLIGVDFTVTPSAHSVHPTLGRGRVGDFSLSAHSPTLLGSAYHQLALTIVNAHLLRACAECGKYFAVADKRQRFCSQTCGSRARQRRFVDRKQEA